MKSCILLAFIPEVQVLNIEIKLEFYRKVPRRVHKLVSNNVVRKLVSLCLKRGVSFNGVVSDLLNHVLHISSPYLICCCIF